MPPKEDGDVIMSISMASSDRGPETGGHGQPSGRATPRGDATPFPAPAGASGKLTQLLEPTGGESELNTYVEYVAPSEPHQEDQEEKIFHMETMAPSGLPWEEGQREQEASFQNTINTEMLRGSLPGMADHFRWMKNQIDTEIQGHLQALWDEMMGLRLELQQSKRREDMLEHL